jgi:hypothetical protein
MRRKNYLTLVNYKILTKYSFLRPTKDLVDIGGEMLDIFKEKREEDVRFEAF